MPVASASSRLLGGWTADQVEDIGEATARAALIGTLFLQGLLFLATLFLVTIPVVRRALTPRGLKRDRVRRRAQEQFLAKNLQATRERTGVLIYVSVKEHMAELLADEGIAGKVDAKAWDPAMAALVDGLKRERPAEGFTAAIGLCAEILAEHFPAHVGDNPNELPDNLTILP